MEIQRGLIEIMKKQAVIITVLFLLFGCTGIVYNNENKTKVIMNTQQIINFVNSGKYKKSFLKSDIPEEIIDFLTKLNGNQFEIGDSTEIESINFSDVILLDSLGKPMYKYNKEIIFILQNQNNCLIVYREGGLGTHEVVDYFYTSDKIYHIHHKTPKIIQNEVDLVDFLQELKLQELE